MHLLNTSMITLSEFKNEAVPEYAILSYRWDESEVSFQELRDGKLENHAMLRKGPAMDQRRNCF
jgi:hypothetical protein